MEEVVGRGTFWYRVLWAEPNGIAHHERVNIALVVFGDGEAPRWIRLKDWARVAAFHGHDDTDWDALVDRYVDDLKDRDDLGRHTYQTHYMSCIHMDEPLVTLTDDVEFLAHGILAGFPRKSLVDGDER